MPIVENSSLGQGFEKFDPEEYPVDSALALGAVAAIINSGGQATRSEVRRVLETKEKHDYEWCRYRLEELQKGGVLKINWVDVEERGRAQKRYEVAEGFKTDAERCRAVLSMMGSDTETDEVRIEHLAATIQRINELEERIDKLESNGVSESLISKQDWNKMLERMAKLSEAEYRGRYTTKILGLKKE